MSFLFKAQLVVFYLKPRVFYLKPSMIVPGPAGTHWRGVDKDADDDEKQDGNQDSDDPPLVVLPDDELEGLPGGGEPEEGSGWTAGRGGEGRGEESFCQDPPPEIATVLTCGVLD